MDKASFQKMWDDMQKSGYFANHPHYTDHWGIEPTDAERALDEAIISLDFSEDEICMPAPYSDALERSVKRTEAVWLNQMFNLPTHGIALDIGCGFGRSVRWMSGQYDAVIGTDISEDVLQESRKRCSDLGNVTFLVNAADSVPAEIADASIDTVYVFTVFQHIPREYSAGILQGINRVLKPGGQVVFNLLSNYNEDENSGTELTEWAIGYNKTQAKQLLVQAGLKPSRIVRWMRPEIELSWLWISASL